MAQDLLEFLMDLITFRFHRVLIKSKEFYKRNLNRCRHIYNIGKHEWHKFKHGCKELYNDGKYYLQKVRSRQ